MGGPHDLCIRFSCTHETRIEMQTQTLDFTKDRCHQRGEVLRVSTCVARLLMEHVPWALIDATMRSNLACREWD
jgi:hypothetical protein